MKATDRAILLGMLAIAAIAVFWFVILSPKRKEASSLGEDVAALRTSVAQQEDLAAYAELARDDYDGNYHRLVVLGKAVPEDSDTPSLLIQLQSLADDASVDFQSAALASTEALAAPAAAPTAATPPPAAPPSGSGAAPAAPSGGSATPATTAAAAAQGSQQAAAAVPTATGAAPTAAVPTEAAAATLPIGATVGPAGLPTMPYDLAFTGGFFEVADFFDGLDDLVHTSGERVAVDGRLLTVDGFTLETEQAAVGSAPSSDLNVKLHATSYLTPAAQGLTVGGTPAGPAPTAAATPTPASTTPAAP